MKRNHTLYKAHLLLLSALFGASTAQAAIDISQVPLQTGSAIPPNVMFIIDDSGSMHWEVTPDRLRGTSNRPSLMFPLTSDIYGSSNSPDKVPSFRFTDGSSDNEKITAAYYRTPSINTSYYDPAITYQPWVKADGSLFPNANPSAAFHHPIRTSKGSRNLTANNTQSTAWVTCTGVDGASCSESSQSRSFYPAVYFRYNGAGLWNKNNYSRVEIRNTTPLYIGDGRGNRTDCANAAAQTCTYNEEIQNFANWYTYYRSRLLAAKGAIGIAFSAQSDKMRVGFGSLNNGSTTVDGVSTKSIITGVRPFGGSARTAFYQQLYERDYPYSGTPLREALQRAGDYFSRSDDRGPWSLTPGVTSASPEEHIECRQSFTVLMTDGVWSSGSISNIANEDNSAGQQIFKPSGESFQYQPGAPFADAYSDTLADVAMYYWKKDLRPDLENRVPVTAINPAFWQHMVTFGIGFGVDGVIDPVAAFDAINTKATINWQDPNSSTTAKTDDLLHASVNGRGGFFTADNPKLFGEKLGNTLNQIVQRVASASNLAGTTTSLQADKFVYQGSFNSGNWSGGLRGFNIGDVTTPLWEANFPVWNSRKIVFGKKNGGAEDFNPATVAADNNALATKPLVVDYLRGSRAFEPTNGNFRARASLLGDIANSSPAYSAAPARRPYSRYSFDGASSYLTHVANNANRTPMLYVGANDGMLHAFNATTGLEKFAYIPQQALTTQANLASYADANYEHKYFVDGSPVVADVYNGSWKTIVVGSMGRGGNSLFVLDVNQPDSFDKNKVLWDKTFAELGVITTKPVVARLNNNKWAIIAGYGYNNSTNKAGLLVIDALTGAVLKNIVTPAGFNTGDNGSSQVEGWDANSDGNTDWFFAGDLQGNIWKYDLSSSNTADWGVAYSNKPLFTAKDAAGNKQSITGGISLATDTLTGKLWVFFGTGSMLTDEDPLLNTSESWYGIQDGSEVTSRGQLQARTMTNVSFSGQIQAREVGAAQPGDMNGKKGWFIDLIDARERIVSTPVFVGNTLLANSVIPGNSDCNPEGDGWVMAIDPFKGSRLDIHFFDFNGDRKFNNDDGITSVGGGPTPVPASGLKFDSMTNAPLIFEDDSSDGSIMVTGETGLGINANYVNTGVRRGRVSWRELTN